MTTNINYYGGFLFYYISANRANLANSTVSSFVSQLASTLPLLKIEHG